MIYNQENVRKFTSFSIGFVALQAIDKIKNSDNYNFNMTSSAWFSLVKELLGSRRFKDAGHLVKIALIAE